MTLEERVTKLEKQVNNLQDSFIRAQKNQVPITAKVDDSANKVVELTPYTETKKAYIGDTEIVFYNVPSGNLTVYFSNYYENFEVERIADRVIVTFYALNEQTEITISIS